MLYRFDMQCIKTVFYLGVRPPYTDGNPDWRVPRPDSSHLDLSPMKPICSEPAWRTGAPAASGHRAMSSHGFMNDGLP